MQPLRVAIVGCGLIGKRRAAVARELGDQVVVVADVDQARAEQLAHDAECAWTDVWQDAVSRDDVDVVVVSTINSVLAPVTIAAAAAGKHVLCEKPLGRNAREAAQMVAAAQRAGVRLKTGFNHRHHPAIWQAHVLCDEGALGPLHFIRAVYGHGGRPCYDKEWRANAELAGGGELLDQGVHIVDLCRWFARAGAPSGQDFTAVLGATATCFWDLGHFTDDRYLPAGSLPATQPAQLEDNAFALLRTDDGCIAQFHTSWTQWKNRFSFEVFGRDGYVRVEGLGGSYGTERLEVGRRNPAGGAPAVESFEFPGPDRSWHAEWQEFTAAIREGRAPLASGADGLQTMRLLAALYASARSGQFVRVATEPTDL